jgi:hypothetical protein
MSLGVQIVGNDRLSALDMVECDEEAGGCEDVKYKCIRTPKF